MKRRLFLGSALTAGSAGILGLGCNDDPMPWDRSPIGQGETAETIAGLPIGNLREDYRHRLLDVFILQWENGGFDSERGGFTTLLKGDGSPAADEKRLIDQGTGLWVYSYLYNNLGEDEEFLGIATKTRDFLVNNFKDSNGVWIDSVRRDGSPVSGVSNNILGWLHVANGLTEFYRATKNDEDRDLVFETVWSTLRNYDAIGYEGIANNGGIAMDVPLRGLRKLDHSAAVIMLLANFLSDMKSRRFEEELARHLAFVSEDFFNPKVGVLNEYLGHDYQRINGYEDYMQTGSAIETMCTIMFYAKDSENGALFEDSISAIRRYLEMAWDYTFNGIGDGHFYVFDGPDRQRTKLYDSKSLNVHCAALTALFHIYEFTGESWALDWYGRVRGYTTEKFDSETAAWPESLDRFGRPAIDTKTGTTRRDLYQLPRWLMMNLLAIDRMMETMGVTEELS